mgnify:CR=1 FL=1
MISVILLTVACAVLQIIDWHTTRTILLRGGSELNPVAKAGMKALGMDGYLVVKGIAVTAVTWFATLQWHLLGVAIVAWYAFWMYRNWKEMKKNKQ